MLIGPLSFSHVLSSVVIGSLAVRGVSCCGRKLVYRSLFSDSQNSPPAMIREIKFDELVRKLDNDEVMLIDVRNPDEISEGKIPKSHVVPLPEFQAAFSLADGSFVSKYRFEKPHEHDNVVISCRSGKRATTANDILQKHGYSNTSVYLGSYIDWVERGGKVEKPGSS